MNVMEGFIQLQEDIEEELYHEAEDWLNELYEYIKDKEGYDRL